GGYGERLRGLFLEKKAVLVDELAGRRIEALSGGQTLLVDVGETDLEFLEFREQIPVGRRSEGSAFALPIYQQFDGDRLHPAGAQFGSDLLPEDGRQSVAEEPVQNAARLLSADEGLVDVARVRDGFLQGFRRDFVKDDSLDLEALLQLEELKDVPRNALPFAIFVG